MMPNLDAGKLQELHELLQANQKITAIKKYREWTGAGLEEAKEAVELVHSASSVIPDEADDENWEEDLLDLLRKQRKVDAVKLYRKNTGLGLKESHQAVLKIAEKEGLEISAGIGCFSIILILCSATIWFQFF